MSEPITIQSPLHVRGVIVSSTFKLHKTHCTFTIHKAETRRADTDEWTKEDKEIPQIVYWVTKHLRMIETIVSTFSDA